MNFESVYGIPESLLHGERHSRYLKKEDVPKLKEFSLLYFLRKSHYNILHDFPVMGAYDKRLISSGVEGPFDSVPNIKEQKRYSGFDETILELLIPANLMPVEFEGVSLVEYGTMTDGNSMEHLNFVAKERINPEEIMKIGEEVLNSAKKKLGLEQKFDFGYGAFVDDCLLEFVLRPDESYRAFYPLVEVKVFGRGEKPARILQELEIGKICLEFPGHYQDIGIRDSLIKGLAYDLKLEKDRDISDLIKSENVIL